ncbi:hypothetical protein PHMEG_0005406 [Phytophthora megakarya]|uniref:Uncharacterized protein n=1 Tax=Phytophthora megakarya TaxID=4795 RepID=A0A225WRB5_9STRA|nr:hypothetical protein PHMEG_0005406 [Phytophthora megakarya]
MERRGVGKRLTDGQRVEILKFFESGATVTEADVARRYGVTRSAIWRLRRSGPQILERYQDGDLQSRDERRRGSNNHSLAISSVETHATQSTATFAMPNTSSRRLQSTAVAVAVVANPGQVATKVQPEPAQQQPIQSLESTAPLIYMAAKAISSVQSPGIVNWERVNGHGDEDFFEVVNDGICVLQEGNYQINVDLQHSQPRQNYKFVFKVWYDKTLLSQCSCPLRTKKEVSFSLLETKCHLSGLAKLRVEFLAPGFAFHESRVVLRFVQ